MSRDHWKRWRKGTEEMEEEKKGRQDWKLKEGRQVGGSQARRTEKKWNRMFLNVFQHKP